MTGRKWTVQRLPAPGRRADWRVSVGHDGGGWIASGPLRHCLLTVVRWVFVEWRR